MKLNSVFQFLRYIYPNVFIIYFPINQYGAYSEFITLSVSGIHTLYLTSLPHVLPADEKSQK